MGKKREKVCGADIHKNKIVATILSISGTKIQAEFGTTLPELLRFKTWLINKDCKVIAMESTGTYWIPLYSVLESNMKVIVANPYMIKHIPGRRVSKVVDGDTFDALLQEHDSHISEDLIRIRLADINCLETRGSNICEAGK